MWWSAAMGRWLVVVATLAVSQVNTRISQTINIQRPKTISPKPCTILTYQDKNETEVLCEGLHALQEVRTYLSSDQVPRVTQLTVRRANFSSFTLDDLVDFESLHTLMFNSSFVSNWQPPSLTSIPKVRTLVLDKSWDNETLETNVKTLTLNITQMQFLSVLPGLEELYIYDCYIIHLSQLYNSSSLQKLNIIDAGRIAIADNTTCFSPSLDFMKTSYSLNENEFLTIMEYRKETQRECPAPCNCSVTGMKENKLPMVHIMCRNVGLTELPQIPRYTTRAYLERNNITNMTALFTNERYHRIDSILLDHNHISYMDGQLFYNYMPVKEMKRVYDEGLKQGKSYFPTFSLGNNPWNCDDCQFIQEFQNLVYYQRTQINKERALINIRCAEWTSNAGRQVIKLDVKSLCAPDPPLLEPLDILNICMGIFLLLLIINFLHNFHQYRRHGKLPWIITQVPCC
ncbi:halfway-like [Homarus americanus]|uniref:Halfway-like n=1 Tax=Homarus americanus TaxID=6706 RepID=A0A8J5MNM0_HOMAM|nr:halfway-like [Homarus americanus]